jgi:hypothetical protein
MKAKLFTMTALLAAMAGWAGVSCGSQPDLGCIVAPNGWAALYIPKPAQSLTASCAELVGDELGLSKYSYVLDGGLEPDLNRSRIAIGVLQASLQTGRDTNTAHKLFAQGDIPEAADGQGFCTVATLNPIEQSAPFEPRTPDAGARPFFDLRYDFSNVRIVSTPQAPGTQMVADLTYREVYRDGGSCQGDYTVRAVWPAIDCQGEDGGADVSLCVGEMNPDFPVDCVGLRPRNTPRDGGAMLVPDDSVYRCVLTQDVPAFR